MYEALPTGPVEVCGIPLSDAQGDASVQVTFNVDPLGPMCTVPNVEGRTLAGAEMRIDNHHCSVGKVRGAFSRTVLKGRVISQSPPAGWQNPRAGSRVNLVISKGRP
jgi:beta-lactam-binding protein with PASTA domain